MRGNYLLKENSVFEVECACHSVIYLEKCLKTHNKGVYKSCTHRYFEKRVTSGSGYHSSFLMHLEKCLKTQIKMLRVEKYRQVRSKMIKEKLCKIYSQTVQAG